MATFTEALRALNELRKLPVGWDYGRGGPVKSGIYSSAVTLITLLRDLDARDFDVTPGINGGATVFAYRGNQSLEISCARKGIFDALFEQEDGFEAHRVMHSLGELLEWLGGFGWQSPRLFVSCTLSAMYTRKSDSLETPSIIQQAEAFPSLVPIVSTNLGPIFVPTFGGSMTNAFAESRQFSGEYQQLICQTVAA